VSEKVATVGPIPFPTAGEGRRESDGKFRVFKRAPKLGGAADVHLGGHRHAVQCPRLESKGMIWNGLQSPREFRFCQYSSVSALAGEASIMGGSRQGRLPRSWQIWLAA